MWTFSRVAIKPIHLAIDQNLQLFQPINEWQTNVCSCHVIGRTIQYFVSYLVSLLIGLCCLPLIPLLRSIQKSFFHRNSFYLLSPNFRNVKGFWYYLFWKVTSWVAQTSSRRKKTTFSGVSRKKMTMFSHESANLQSVASIQNVSTCR